MLPSLHGFSLHVFIKMASRNANSTPLWYSVWDREERNPKMLRVDHLNIEFNGRRIYPEPFPPGNYRFEDAMTRAMRSITDQILRECQLEGEEFPLETAKELLFRWQRFISMSKDHLNLTIPEGAELT